MSKYSKITKMSNVYDNIMKGYKECEHKFDVCIQILW